MLSILDLPNEILFEIIRFLHPEDTYRLSQTCQRICQLLNTNVVTKFVKQCIQLLKKPVVFLDIEILSKEGKLLHKGTLYLQLRKDICPRTSENFLQLCLHTNGEKFGFKNTILHRIIPKFMMQGGGFENNGRPYNPAGGKSIYGKRFDDENFDLNHERYTLSMANSGPNTNGSQFFICFVKCKWLDGKHVAFGKLVDGFGMFEWIEKFGTSKGMQMGKPKDDVKLRIVDCGVLSWSNTEDCKILEKCL